MNKIMKEVYPLFRLYQSLREQLMEIVSDDDLSYRPGGANLPLGALCRQIGEVQLSYIQSFKTFKGDFSYRNDEPGLDTSVEKLTIWFEVLDRDLEATIEGLTDDDLENRLIDRGGDFKVSPRIQLEIYKEALLIFYGKASVYLKALEIPLPEQWREWIA